MSNLLLAQDQQENPNQHFYVQEQVIAYYTNISKENIKLLKTLKKHLELISFENFLKNDDVTNLIIGEKEDLSVSLLLGILKGIFVVRESCELNFIE